MASTTIHTLAYKIIADSSKFKTEMQKTNAEIRVGKQLNEAYMTTLERHQMEIQSLETLYQKQRITIDTYNRAMRAQKKAMFEATTAGKALKGVTSALESRVIGLIAAYVGFNQVLGSVFTQAKELKNIGDMAQTFNLPVEEIDKLNFAIKSEGGEGLDTIQQMAKHLGRLQDKFQEGDITKPLGETKAFKKAGSELKQVENKLESLDEKLATVRKQYADATEDLRRFGVLNRGAVLSQQEKFRLTDLTARVSQLSNEKRDIIAAQMELEGTRFQLMGTVAEEADRATDIVVTKQNEIQQTLDKYGIEADKFFAASLPDKMLIVADAVAAINNGEQKLSAINALLGKGSQQWADGILKGRDELEKLFTDYDANMQKISPDLIAKSEELVQTQKNLNTAWVDFSRMLVEVLGPALSDVLTLAKDSLEIMKMLNTNYIGNRVQTELDSMFPGRAEDRNITRERHRIAGDFNRVKTSYGLPDATPKELAHIANAENGKIAETANLMLLELRRLNGIVDPANDPQHYRNETPVLDSN